MNNNVNNLKEAIADIKKIKAEAVDLAKNELSISLERKLENLVKESFEKQLKEDDEENDEIANVGDDIIGDDLFKFDHIIDTETTEIEIDTDGDGEKEDCVCQTPSKSTDKADEIDLTDKTEELVDDILDNAGIDTTLKVKEEQTNINNKKQTNMQENKENLDAELQKEIEGLLGSEIEGNEEMNEFWDASKDGEKNDSKTEPALYNKAGELVAYEKDGKWFDTSDKSVTYEDALKMSLNEMELELEIEDDERDLIEKLYDLIGSGEDESEDELIDDTEMEMGDDAEEGMSDDTELEIITNDTEEETEEEVTEGIAMADQTKKKTGSSEWKHSVQGRPERRSNMSMEEAELKGLKLEFAKLNALVGKLISENKSLKTENSGLTENFSKIKSTLKEHKEKLYNIAVMNANLGHINKLFVEQSTTKEEKLQIVKKFAQANSIEESKKLFTNLNEEFSNKLDTMSIIENKVSKTITSGASKLTESTAYVDPNIEKINRLMGLTK
jgi:hypothetical protein